MYISKREMYNIDKSTGTKSHFVNIMSHAHTHIVIFFLAVNMYGVIVPSKITKK